MDHEAFPQVDAHAPGHVHGRDLARYAAARKPHPANRSTDQVPLDIGGDDLAQVVAGKCPAFQVRLCTVNCG